MLFFRSGRRKSSTGAETKDSQCEVAADAPPLVFLKNHISPGRCIQYGLSRLRRCSRVCCVLQAEGCERARRRRGPGYIQPSHLCRYIALLDRIVIVWVLIQV
jgi:hypothetical protein